MISLTELHVSKDWILLYIILHQVELGVQNNFCAPSIWINKINIQT